MMTDAIKLNSGIDLLLFSEKSLIKLVLQKV